MVSHLLADLGWVDFDSGVSPSCPAAQPTLQNFHQSRQNKADSGAIKIQVNPTHEQTVHPVLMLTNYKPTL